LKEFVYVDEAGKDVGANVRQKAKDITNLLQDDERLRTERRSRGAMRDRMLGNIEASGLRGDSDYGDRSGSPPPPSRYQPPAGRPRRGGDEDEDLQRAIEASMNSNEDEAKRRSLQNQEEDDLAKALRLSKEEDARKKRELEDANKTALFDDSLNL
jgi:epsin